MLCCSFHILTDNQVTNTVGSFKESCHTGVERVELVSPSLLHCGAGHSGHTELLEG